uniref:DUF1758 domain-containing protein n=1 Tax=Cacopsylla melanoneura TaxID=428564 RepID=A0A8D8QBA9_9HEMI
MLLTSNRKEDVVKLYIDLETNLKLLENLDNQVEGEVLASCLFKKLSQETQRKLVEIHTDNITVSNIRARMKQEVKEERVLKSLTPQCGLKTLDKFDGFQSENTQRRLPFKGGYTAEALVSADNDRSRYSQPYCVFCDHASHFSDECQTYPTIADRKRILDKRCYVCTSRKHPTHHCQNASKCYHCGKIGSHYRALCPDKFPRGNNPGFRSYGNRRQESQRPNNGNPYSSNNLIETQEVSTSPVSVETQEVSNSNPIVGEIQGGPSSVNAGVYSNSSSISNKANQGNNHHAFVYFQTATITVLNKDSNRVCEVRALFDSGSSHSYITESLKSKLHMNDDLMTSLNMNMFTFGAEAPKTVTVGKGFITILDKKKTQKDIEVCVVPNIINNHSRSPFDNTFVSYLRSNYDLADHYYSGREEDSLNIDLLIGSDYYNYFIKGCPIKVGEDLYLIESPFGFILNGKTSVVTDREDAYQFFLKAEMPMKDLQDLKQFWSLETLGIKDSYNVSNDDLALQSFEKSLNYDDEKKRYFVSFPWINDCRDLKSNHGIAVGCLKTLARRHKDDGILKICEETFNDQIKKGVLEEVVDDREDELCHYLPYFAIVDEKRETTKVRFVMNASCRGGKNGHSLNDMLYRGPVLLENLGSLLLRFRLNKFGVIADLEKAFLNIGLNNEDRDFTRIVWIKDINKEVTQNNIIILRHTRIPFGVNSSPFLLGAVVSTHLSKFSGEIPTQLKRDIYVDNVITGVETEEELEKLVVTSRDLFDQASLNLRSWATSIKNSKFFNNLDPSITSQKEVQTVLGFSWDTYNDTLIVKHSFHYKNEPVTKRLLLSACSSFYDMLGFWSPILITLKVLIQKAWIEDKSWDEKLSDQDSVQFVGIVSDLESAASYPIPRDVNLHMPNVEYELHAFSDACITSYSAVVYLRCTSSDQTQVNIVFAKARVAPKERPTLPRLELLGALLAFRCLKYVVSSLNLKLAHKYYLWCDNMTVLHWILGDKILPTFVQNRVREIKSSSFKIDFR